MKHTFKKLLCVILALTMIVGMLPVAMFASAAPVICESNQLLVDDDFAEAGAKETVTATVGGVQYQAVMGTNAFATLAEAVSKAPLNSSIYIAAGEYSDATISITQNIGFYGNGMNVNPNNPDWTPNPVRADLANETVLNNVEFNVTTKALTRVVVNGFTFLGKSTIKEATSGSTCKGIDISYNCFYDNEQISGANGVIYITGTTVRSGCINYNRITHSASAAKPLTFRNGNNFTIKGNYVNIAGTTGLWITAEIADQNTTPGQMLITIEDNNITAGYYPIQHMLQYADAVDLTLRNNILTGAMGLWITSMENSTPQKKLTIVGNTLTGKTSDFVFDASTKYDPELITVKNNTLVNGTVEIGWQVTGGVLDFAYNTFLKDASINCNPAPITYPRYNSNGELLGDMQLDSVSLTGNLSEGGKSTIAGITVDNENRTVSLKETVDSTFDSIEISAKAKTNADGSTVAIKYYSDPACTKELTDGNLIDYLKKGLNLVYIKLTTSLDNYSYVVYTLSLNRDASHKALASGVAGYDSEVVGDTINATIPTEDTSPNLQVLVSSGATYQIFTDKDLNKPISGTIINDLPAGSSTYYVKVTAEDGENTAIYTLNLIRAPYSNTDIIKFTAPEYVDYDEDEGAYLAVYTNERTAVDVEIEVAPRATWALFEDIGCKKEIETKGIALEEGDNVFYIRVTSEAGVAEAVHKVIFRRESVAASKQIFAVTSAAVSSAVEKDAVSILLNSKTTDYTPAFKFTGSYWKLFASYEDGVLSAQVPANRLTAIESGKHTYYIQVFAADGSYRVYTLTLEREAANEALLLAIGGGIDSYVDRFDFVATTQVKDEGAFTPSFKISDKATIAVFDKDGSEVTFPVMLRAGDTVYTIVVTAENGVKTTEYVWTVTCIGDEFTTLTGGVAYDPAWKDLYELGDVIYAPINGEYVKAYYGENAFDSWTQARSQALVHGGVLYVMPGVSIDSSFTTNGIKIYGANFAVNPNNGNRFEESYLLGKVTMNGEDPEVKGFTIHDSAQVVISTGIVGAEIENNIFKDDAVREVEAIYMNGTKANASLTIANNRFEMNTAEPTIHIRKAGEKCQFKNNYFNNKLAGTMLNVLEMVEGASIEFANNEVVATSGIAISLEDNQNRYGYLNVNGNTFKSVHAILMNASKAKEDFVLNFYNNKVETSALSVVVSSAPATFATNFTANKNTFKSIDVSFGIEYKSSVDVTMLEKMDVERNYYGTATPGNDVFDNTYSYKPYYLNKEMTYLSNVIQPVTVTVAGRPIIEGFSDNYAIVPEDTAELKIAFKPNANIPAAALGTATVKLQGGVAAEAVNVVMNGKKTATYTVTSADGTASETHGLTLYPQTANPVYDVYNVNSATIDGMTVRVIVDNKATQWTPALATIDELPIDFYADAECTEKLNGAIALPTAKTTVYGVVGEYETVEFIIYKKQSSEKAILDFVDAYTFEYTGSATLDVTVDNRIPAADLTADVSAGAAYKVYADASCTVAVDESAVTQSVTTLFYEVTAADSTVKVFEVSINWIEVVDPDLFSVKNTTTVSFENDVLVAQVATYNAIEGFTAELVTNAGCTYKLYLDDTKEAVFKNNTVFFDSNYVYVYVTVTSPDGVVSKDYIVKLTRDPGTIKFVDQGKIPNWAKKAVEVTKGLGIVSGEKVADGYLLNANGKATREVMAAFMIRMMGIDASQYSYVDLASKFADADKVSSWAVSSVKAAVALNIFSGAKNGNEYYLNPKNNITRQEFAIMFVKAIGADETDVKAYALNYKDAAAIAKWARTYVKIISKLGYMQGSNGNFYPKNEVTRAEIIQTIYNYMY